MRWARLLSGLLAPVLWALAHWQRRQLERETAMALLADQEHRRQRAAQVAAEIDRDAARRAQAHAAQTPDVRVADIREQFAGRKL